MNPQHPRNSGRLPFAGVAALVAALIASLSACGTAPPEPSAAVREAVNYNQRAARALRAGRIDAARTLYESALRVDRSVENTDGIAVNLLGLARVEQAAGNLPAAQAHLDSVLASAPLALPAARKAEAAARRALIGFDAGDNALAADWSRRAEELCVPAACPARAAIANLRARASLAAGDHANAILFARRALDASGSAAPGTADDPRIERANANRILGEASIGLRDTRLARQALAEALALDQALGRADRIRRDLLLLANVHKLDGDRDGARSLIRRALVVSNAAGDVSGAREAQALLDAP